MPFALSKVQDALEKAALTARPKTHEERDDDVSADIDTILASTEKLLAVSRGVTDADERDSLEFRQVMRPADLLSERVHLDADKLLRVTMRRLAKQRSLKVVGPSHFDRYATGLLIGHELSSPLEEINPLQLVEQARRITQMGPGGLPSTESITPEAQNLHPSQFGFLSAIEGPESEKIGVDTRLAWGARYGSDGRLYQKFTDRKSGQQRWVSYPEIAGRTIGLPR